MKPWGNDSEWGDAVMARLRQLFSSAGQPSASTIAAELNHEFRTSFSRNAIIGKVGRLGLKRTITGEQRGRTPDQGIIHRIVVKAKAAARPRPAPKPADVDEEIPDAVIDLPPDQSPDALRLVDLEIPHCRWPMGDPLSDEFRFCGSKRKGSIEDWVSGRHQYCQRHHTMAFSTARRATPEEQRAAAIKRRQTRQRNEHAHHAPTF